MKKFLLLSIIITLVSCGSLQEAGKVMRNEKINTTDEFLVKKKNPLVLPPKFGELPSPEENTQDQSVISSSEIEKLLIKKKNETKKIQKSKNIKNIEDNILEKIKD